MAAATPKIEIRRISTLRPYPGNARRHSKKQVRQIADSIQRFGFTNPVLISDDDEIIAGHGRVMAAKTLSVDTVPTIKLSHLSPAERRAYVLADNKLALNAGWDSEILAIELQALVDIDFDISLTGFSLAEVDFVLDEHARRRRKKLRQQTSFQQFRQPQCLVTVTYGCWAAIDSCAGMPGTVPVTISC